MLDVEGDEAALPDYQLDLGLAELELLQHSPHLRLTYYPILNLLES